MRVICSECGAEVRSCEVSHSVSVLAERDGELGIEIYVESPVYTCGKCGNMMAVLNVKARMDALRKLRDMDGEEVECLE